MFNIALVKKRGSYLLKLRRHGGIVFVSGSVFWVFSFYWIAWTGLQSERFISELFWIGKVYGKFNCSISVWTLAAFSELFAWNVWILLDISSLFTAFQEEWDRPQLC